MAAKTFTTDENQVLINALAMAKASYVRRVNAEADAEAKKFWQAKADAVDAVTVKVKLT